MESLTITNLTDLRETIERRIVDLKGVHLITEQAQRERDRKITSLKQSLDKINERIKDIQFEDDQLPFSTIPA
jgi:hypothetical protein